MAVAPPRQEVIAREKPSEADTEMERAGHGHDAEKRHEREEQTVLEAGREGKFVFFVAEFWYELRFKRS